MNDQACPIWGGDSWSEIQKMKLGNSHKNERKYFSVKCNSKDSEERNNLCYSSETKKAIVARVDCTRGEVVQMEIGRLRGMVIRQGLADHYGLLFPLFSSPG